MDSERESDGELSVPDAAQTQPIGENLYALLISEISVDYVKLLDGSSRRPLVRTFRLVYSLLLIGFVIFLQVFLLFCVSSMLCGPATLEIRQVYGDYERAVYDKIELSRNGYPRGLPGEEPNHAYFLKMDMDEKQKVCGVPLSQPLFTFTLLFIWTLTCIAEIRATVRLGYALLWLTPIKSNVEDCIEQTEESRVIVGLTKGMKVSLSLICFLPRLLALAALNFLGCRWLLSTVSLQDLFLNSLALEFILVLPELLYKTFSSHRSMMRTEGTFVQQRWYSHLDLMGVVSSVFWGFLAAAWVYMYMYYLQQVLPDYLWDIHKTCAQHAAELGQ